MSEPKVLQPIEYERIGKLGQRDDGLPFYHEWSDASGSQHWVEDGLNDSIASADESELAGEVLRLASVVRGYQFLCADRDHSIDVLNTALAEARAEIEKLKREKDYLCDACGGTGKPASGVPCICGGTGSGGDEKVGLRTAVFDAENARDEARAEADERMAFIAGLRRSARELLNGGHPLMYRDNGLVNLARRVLAREEGS